MTMRRNISLKPKFILLIAACLALGVTYGVVNRMTLPEYRSLSFFVPGTAPYTPDPFEFDYFMHHRCFKSVFANLIDHYSLKKRAGLAEQWESNPDQTEWTIALRSDIFFSNGSPITSESVAVSLSRLAYLLHKKGSSHHLFTNMIGYGAQRSAADILQGIVASGSSIVLRFKTSSPDVPDKLAFGMYGIVHPSNFDQNSGAWSSESEVVASGPYRIFVNDGSKVELRVHPFVNQGMIAKKAPTHVVIRWGEIHNLIGTEDVIAGNSDFDVPNGYIFNGPVMNSFFYMHCFAWKNQKSRICADPILRLQVRNKIYQRLGVSQVSLFPPLTKGVTPTSVAPTNKEQSEVSLNGETVRVRKFIQPSKAVLEFLSAFEAVIKEMDGRVLYEEISGKDLDKLLEPSSKNFAVDMGVMGSGILVENPVEDLKFMFLSKEGIRLPNASAKIIHELQSTSPSVQMINEYLVSDGIVWPISHFSKGLWHRSRVRLEQINMLRPPIDFSWVEVWD